MSINLDEIEGITPELKAILETKIKEVYVPKSEFDAIAAKQNELLDETKAAKRAKAKAIEDAAAAAAEKALKDNDLASYRASTEGIMAALKEELEGMKTATKEQRKTSIAAKFVSEKFVNDAIVAEAITEKFKKRIDIRDGKEVILDKDGNLTAMSLQDLQAEFLGNEALKSHIIGTRASGSGASGSGGKSGGGAAKIISKQDFDALNPQEKMDYMKNVKTLT